MQPTKALAHAPKWRTRVSYALSGLAALFLILDGVVKIMNIAAVREAHRQLGYPESVAVGLGTVLLVCTILYVTPQTSVLGAMLLTGYLGGATATHVRVADPFYFPNLIGVVIWGALYLRDEQVRALIPLRR